MRRVLYCLLMVPVLSLIVSCDAQKQKDDRATETFRTFADRVEKRLTAAALMIATQSDRLSEIPGSSQPSVAVTYDVKRSTSTVTPDAYSATLEVRLRSDEQTSSVAAEYTFAKGMWSTSKVGDTRPIEQHLEKLEERMRAHRRDVGNGKLQEEGVLAIPFDTFRDLRNILKYSDADPKAAGK